MKKTAPLIDFELLRSKLKLKNLENKRTLVEKHPHVKGNTLHQAFDINSLRKKSARLLGAGAVGGTLLLAPSVGVLSTHVLPSVADSHHEIQMDAKVIPIAAPQKMLIDTMKKILPAKPRPLTKEEETSLEGVFESVFKVPARATLEGEHLNTTYGYIGAEQHLRRFPGDKVADQAPGLGAWGYFAQSKEQMTPKLEETEKWYAVVQTLYLPEWGTRLRYLRDWYKYRKVLIVNTQNGNAVVAAIADSGPAQWTGKQFGGSPEVMEYLGGPRYKKGAVIIFFIEDPEDKIKLGPVEYNKIDLPEWAFHQI